YNSALLDESGNLVSVLSLVLDVTERMQADLERINLLEREKTARTQAETANRIKDEFLAVLSHELRSPLNPILGWSKLLQSRKLDEKTVARGLETIERNAKLQTQLIEDLLDVSRILRGKLTLNVCPIDLVSTIEAALETVRLAACAKSIEIRMVYEPNVGQVLGDPNRLQQVVWNLLSNAIKFTPAGGRVEVRLSTHCDWKDTKPNSKSSAFDNQSNNLKSNYAQIQVSDTGKGINAEFLPYVFDYFRQENSSTTRSFGGLGLGLAIVRHLVELHGGTVKAESLGEGQGATFTVRLPLTATQPEMKPSKQDYENAPDLSGIRILVVDDEADMREFLAFTLEGYGAEVIVVSSAAEALEALCEVKPDVLLSDVGMPEVDGYMLIRQIRAMPPERGGQIRAIALTAYAGETDQTQALSAGFQKHVAKPVEPAELAAVVASLIRG
ncbi:MAG: response regulator, partial [Coleofasciculus sp. S288]|nr:response regulator [Coleofasciculus sp. S288]